MKLRPPTCDTVAHTLNLGHNLFEILYHNSVAALALSWMKKRRITEYIQILFLFGDHMQQCLGITPCSVWGHYY